jgi:hypothetical protein
VKISSLVLSVIAAAPHGAAMAEPAAAPPATAPPPAAAPPAAPPPPVTAPPVAAARAAPSIGPPSEMAPAAPPAAAPPRDEKSPLIAFSLSFFAPIAVTAGSVLYLDPDEGAGSVLLGISVIVGPSSGWFYVGRPLTGLATAATRFAGFALAIGAIHDSPSSSGASLALGATLILGATLADWIGPLVVVSKGGAGPQAVVVPAGPGLSIAGSF